VRVPSQPVLSDALDPPVGSLQGLSWFFNAFFRDEWGNIGHELWHESAAGPLRKAKQSRLAAHQLAPVTCPADGLLIVQRR
jgi:hypothetical protein